MIIAILTYLRAGPARVPFCTVAGIVCHTSTMVTWRLTEDYDLDKKGTDNNVSLSHLYSHSYYSAVMHPFA